METINILKTLSQIASEYGFLLRTFYNHLHRHEILRVNIKPGIQTPRFQKMIYETLGYPPSVNKAHYDNV